MSDTLKHYETVLVFSATLGDEAVKAELGKLAADIEGRFNGKVTLQDVWGRRTLAYPILKSREGIYALVQYEAPTGKVVDGLEQKLRINESVLRFLSVNREVELKRGKKGDAEKARRLKKHPPAPAPGAEAPAVPATGA